MSILFKESLTSSPSQARLMANQWEELQDIREGVEEISNTMGSLLSVTGNAARSPAEAYREFDSTTKIDQVAAGEYATLTRLMQKSKSVDIGKLVVEYRKATTSGGGQTSMSGQIGIKRDHVDYEYAGTVVPVHDIGFGRGWREVKSMQSEGFDALVDDAREAERTLMGVINDYLWNGDAAISLKGNVWLGLKADPTVVQYTITTDLSASASTPEAIRNEVRAIRDALYITNNCTKDLRLGVSREILSNWERVFSNSEGTFGTIEKMIKELRGISEIYEDSKLVNNEVTLFWADQQGLHPVVGMAISTYAEKRDSHNSDFNFVKWSAVGFLAKTDAENRKCALYGS